MAKTIDKILYAGLIAFALAAPVSAPAAAAIMPVLIALLLAKSAVLKKIDFPPVPAAAFAAVFLLAAVLPRFFAAPAGRGILGTIGSFSILAFFAAAGGMTGFRHAKYIAAALLASFVVAVLLCKNPCCPSAGFYACGPVCGRHAGAFCQFFEECFSLEAFAGFAAGAALAGAYFFYGIKKIRMVPYGEKVFIAACMIAVLAYAAAGGDCVRPPAMWMLLALPFYRSRAAFLDRDGTINDDMKYSADPSKLKLLPGAAEAVKMLNGAGFRAVIVTNQSGVARGCFTLDDVKALNALVVGELKKGGARIDGIYVCPHHPDKACGCRKPNTGMIKKASRELNIAAAGSYVVGDMKTDMQLARNAGVKGIFVLTGAEKVPPEYADYVAKDLLEAAALITGRKER